MSTLRLAVSDAGRSTALRTAYGLPITTFVTLGLFLFMWQLINPKFETPPKPEPVPPIDFLREPPEPPEIIGRPELEDLVTPTEPPPPPPRPDDWEVTVIDGEGMPPIKIPGLVDDVTVNVLGPPADRSAQPIFRVPPQYPQGAIVNEIEGWVLLEFDITETGGVANIEIVDAVPLGVFDAAARNAIAKWKYKPKFVDGKPVPQRRIQQVISFNLSDD